MPSVAAVLDFEITRKLTELSPPESELALVLFRLHGRPLGWGASRVTDGHLDAAALGRQFVQQHAWTCALPMAECAVHSGRLPSGLDASRLFQSPPPGVASGPLVTVAVRNRTRSSHLRPCLDALMRLDYSPLDLVLIDVSDDRRQVEALVRDQYPHIRYISSSGWGTASRLAVAECRGDILALTDGDAAVDPHWVSSLVHVFLADPEVMTVSGLVLPRSVKRPFSPAIPAGAPFCRRWWRTRDDMDAGEGATQRALERACPNIAYWRPASSVPARYTRVWEPSAIVRTPGLMPAPRVSARRGPVRETDRTIDLAEGLSSIADASTYDSLRVHVRWAGRNVGTVRIPHRGAVVSPLWLGDVIAQELTSAVLDAGTGLGAQVSRALLTADLARYILARWDIGRPGSSSPSAARTVAA